jgi:hypothetical protein
MDKTFAQTETEFSFDHYFTTSQKEHDEKLVSAYDFIYHLPLLKEEYDIVKNLKVKVKTITNRIFWSGAFFLFHLGYILYAWLTHQSLSFQTWLPSALFALIGFSFIKPFCLSFLDNSGLSLYPAQPKLKKIQLELDADWNDHIQLLSNADFQYQLLRFLNNRDLVNVEQLNHLKELLTQNQLNKSLEFLLTLPLSIQSNTRDKSMEQSYWQSGLQAQEK